MSSTAPALRARVPRLAEAALERARLTVVPRRARRRTQPGAVPAAWSRCSRSAASSGCCFQHLDAAGVVRRDRAPAARPTRCDAQQQSLQMELDQLRDPQSGRPQGPADGHGAARPARPSSTSDGKVLGTPAPATRLDPLRLLAPPPPKPAELDPPAHVTVVHAPATQHDGRLDGATRRAGRATTATRTVAMTTPVTPSTTRHASSTQTHEPPTVPTAAARPLRSYAGPAQPPPGAAAPRRRVAALRGSAPLRLRIGLRVHRDGAVVLRCPAGAAPGRRARRSTPRWRPRGRHGHRRAARRRAATILDRNGEPLADSVDGRMVVADPSHDHDEGARAGALPGQAAPRRLLHDPAARCSQKDTRFAYIARRVPAALAIRVVNEATDAGLQGARHPQRPGARPTPTTTSPPTWSASWAPTGRWRASSCTFDKQLAGTDGSETYEVGAGNRIPLGHSTVDAGPQRHRPAHHHRPGPAVVHPAGAAPDRARARGATPASRW